MRRPVKAQFSVVRSKSTGSRIFQQNSCIYYKFNSWWKKLSLFNPLIHKVCFLVQLPMHAAWRWQQQQQQRYNYDYFNTESSLNFNVQSGLQYLTWRLHQLPFIGSPLPLSFITEQTYGIKDFELGLCDRAIGDGDKTQTLASRICRLHVMPRISALFAPVEEALLATFLPALFGGDDVDGHLRALTCLPVKFSGLGIPDPVPSTPNNLQNSQVACSLLIFALQTRS